MQIVDDWLTADDVKSPVRLDRTTRLYVCSSGVVKVRARPLWIVSDLYVVEMCLATTPLTTLQRQEVPAGLHRRRIPCPSPVGGVQEHLATGCPYFDGIHIFNAPIKMN